MLVSFHFESVAAPFNPKFQRNGLKLKHFHKRSKPNNVEKKNTTETKPTTYPLPFHSHLPNGIRQVKIHCRI